MSVLDADAARGRVRALIERWIGRGLNVYPAKEPPFDPEDGGVPPAMWAEEPGADGWVRWKAIPGAAGETDVRAIEARIDAPLPPLVRAYLTYACVGPIESPRHVRLPALWSDAPMRDVLAAIEQWSPLERAGYLVIAEDANDAGPLCLDLRGRGPDGDCPIVLFDHERLIAIGADGCADRKQVAALASLKYASFDALLDQIDRTLEGSLRPSA